MVNHRYEEVKIVGIGEAQFLQSVPQCNGYWEEAVGVELILTKEIRTKKEWFGKMCVA